MSTEFFGLKACNRNLSTLHAEMKGLLWAVSCMRDMRIRSIFFEMECSDLVDMTTKPMDLPTFASETEAFQRLREDFEEVRLIDIPRNTNVQEDSLAKEARTRGYIFSLVDQTRTGGDALRIMGSSDQNLV